MLQKLKCNLGKLDRILRAGIGLGAIYFGFFSNYLITDKIAALVFGSMGVISLFFAVVGFCPGYAAIGFSTQKHETR